jgi:hypothetical protein
MLAYVSIRTDCDREYISGMLLEAIAGQTDHKTQQRKDMATNIRVFDPTSTPGVAGEAQPRRSLDSLRDKVVGFIDNAKPNFNHLVDDVAEQLQSRYGVKAIVKHCKRVASIPAPDDVIKDIARQCDLVITGSGD